MTSSNRVEVRVIIKYRNVQDDAHDGIAWKTNMFLNSTSGSDGRSSLVDDKDRVINATFRLLSPAIVHAI